MDRDERVAEEILNERRQVRALQGWGFCWANVLPSPDGMTLAVEGCYWACPYDLVFYDFSQPDCLPLPELRRFEGLERVIGWENANTFAFTCGYEIRKADGAKYNSLPAEEQDELDADPNLRAESKNNFAGRNRKRPLVGPGHAVVGGVRRWAGLVLGPGLTAPREYVDGESHGGAAATEPGR